MDNDDGKASMLKANTVPPEEQQFLLSSLSPGHAQKRLALLVVLGILVVFAALTANVFARIEPVRIDAFIPAYATAMFVNDSITAILLFAQFSIVRSRALLVIASGYLFTGLILIPWILTFPGVFAANGLIGGLQSTSALYLCWHAGFVIFVIGYASSKNPHPASRIWRGTVASAIRISLVSTVLVVVAVTLLCTVGEPLWPHVATSSSRFSPLWPYYVGAPIAVLCVAALTLLWMRRRSALDLWLMVVVYLYLVEVPLTYYPDPIRFSAAFYAVRVIGYLASSLVLVVLLYEIVVMYQLFGARAQQRERQARLTTGDAVTATIAHEVRQPLTAIIANADAGLRYLNRPIPDLANISDALKRIVADGQRTARVLGSIRAVFKMDVTNRVSLDINELIREAVTVAQVDLQRHGVRVQALSNRQLPRVQGDMVQLQQVLLNLITNAIDAMSGTDGLRMLQVTAEAHEAGGVIVSVADTGAGIDSQDVDRIFNPLFTTKTDGMGMGLSICRSIIEAHGGRLWATPNTPHGTVFRFSLHANSPEIANA
jgi:signal transduction histidine kinase